MNLRKAALGNVSKGLVAASRILEISSENMASAMLVTDNEPNSAKTHLAESTRVTQNILAQLQNAMKASGLSPEELARILEAIKKAADSLKLLNDASECIEGESKDVGDIQQVRLSRQIELTTSAS